MTEKKIAWETPVLTELGSVKDLTQQVKDKSFGGGDDVLVNNQAILASLGS